MDIATNIVSARKKKTLQTVQKKGEKAMVFFDIVKQERESSKARRIGTSGHAAGLEGWLHLHHPLEKIKTQNEWNIIFQNYVIGLCMLGRRDNLGRHCAFKLVSGF